jgi:AcrR family transcriptional regulator
MSTPSLTERHADLTQTLLVDAAIALLEAMPVTELSTRLVAEKAGVSARTMFRHFPTREGFLDAVADGISRRLRPPPPPQTLQGLLAFPAELYARLEANAALTRAALHSELYDRMRREGGTTRFEAISALIDELAPHRPAIERRVAAANIHYHLIASTWHYYRDYFGFELEDAVRCAVTAVAQALGGLGLVLP